MIELPQKHYNQVNGFDDFDNYRDDDDDDTDKGEMGGVSTNALRSQYVRPRDYRTRRLIKNLKWVLVGGVAAMIVVVMMMRSGSSGSSDSYNSSDSPDAALPPQESAPVVVEGNNEPDHSSWGEMDESDEEQDMERKPIPEGNEDEAHAEDTPPSGGNWFEDDPANTNPAPSPPDASNSGTVDIQPEDGISSAAQEELHQHDKDGEDTPTSTNINTTDANEEEGVEKDIHTTNIEPVETAPPSAAVQNNTSHNENATTSSTTAENEEEDTTTSAGQNYWFEDDNKEPEPPKDSLVPPDTTTDNETPVMDVVPAEEETATNSPEEEAEKGPAAPTVLTPLPQATVTYQYQSRREKPLTLDEQSALHEKWGSWTFVDANAAQRPRDDYCGAYPQRDIPWDQFPPHAWQTDADYLTDFLSQGKDLVMRAMEVHLAEYGFGPDDLPDDSFLDRAYQSPFRLEILDHFSDDPETRRRLSAGVNDYAGWMTQKSFDGLVRRLLHAVVSRDSFNLVLGGHSAAAGHGNHFQQSYALQFQRVMEPVFARLGVKHYSRNTGMGGLGTIQSVMGAQDIYGKDVDILIWDSGMTESAESADFDMFARQGILGSDRAPVLWAGGDGNHIYPTLQEKADVDYMMYGTGLGPIPSITDPTTVDEIPWAARYLKCDPDWASLCKENRYNGTCWIERPDHFAPPTTQRDEPGGRASWHDGNRMHQLYGRTMSFTVLRALYEAIDMWDQQPGKQLKDDMWHVSAYYENIKTKVANLDPRFGTCHGVEDRLPAEFCTMPFQARTEFTPRANPEETSLRSIMKPAGPDQTVPQPKLNIYDAPDVYNPVLGVPEGEVDYLAIIENGEDFLSFQAPASPLPTGTTESSNRLIELTVDDNGEDIVPGLGWGVNTKSSPHLCNGTYDSFCGRSDDQECLLYAHNDYRGGVTFDSLSGWGIFTLKNLKEGMIFVKMDSWRKEKDNPVTEGWTTENNGRLRRGLKKDQEPAKFCPDFKLEFAFGDTIIRLNSDEILGERHSLAQRVVQIWTVLNDREFTEGETVDIELGIRIRGCAHEHVFWVTHIYWA